MISQEDYENLVECHEKIQESMREIDRFLRKYDGNLYERWKAGGKQVTDEFVSCYPNLCEVMESLGEEVVEDEESENEDE